MEGVLIAGLVLAVLAAVFFATRVTAANQAAAKSAGELESMRTRLSAAESEARKASEGVDSKRREIEELKEKLKDVKRKRFDEKEAAKTRRDVEEARLQVEREWEQKLAIAREEAETVHSELRRLKAEVESLRSRRPQAQAVASEQQAPAAASAAASAEPRYRELSPEEKAKLDTAQRELAKTKKKLDETEHELRKARGRSETDRRVYLVQKGELDIAKDRFRSIEARFNELVLERDGLRNALWALEKELKTIKPGAKTPAGAEQAIATPEVGGETAEKPQPATQAVEVTPPADAGASTEGDSAKA